MSRPERQQNVLALLKQLCEQRGLEPLKQLFWSELNYNRVNQPLSRRGWPEAAIQALTGDPVLFAAGGEDNAFHVIYCRLAGDGLPRVLERPVATQLLREHPYALFVFSNRAQTDWHFLNVKLDGQADRRRVFRRITVRRGAGLRTATERIQLLDLTEIHPELSGITPLTIQQRCDAAFDVEAVTKDFFREVANWYFWALKQASFPKDAPKEKDGHDHISIIRLITRLIFCWFVKEKGLIPGELFDQAHLARMLVGFAPEKSSAKGSVFYKAILQNLFFATLNTEMDKRGWRREDQNFMAHSRYRHRDLFQKPAAALDLFKNIPFLNGGLFECLDKDRGESAKPRYIRIDGFSDRPDSQPTVPDFLFFGGESEVDLSGDYGDKKFKRVVVRGLIHTFNRYNFTVEEDTPIDQEVALDPELSGKVFENLLAAYNPETGATARKQTGSFYTPREIVNYMVDEALIACLKTKLDARPHPGPLPRGEGETSSALKQSGATTRQNAPMATGAANDSPSPPTERSGVGGEGRGEVGSSSSRSANSIEQRLRHLFAYNDEPHQFTPAEVDALIAAIDHLKTLDPAVGSGAFPMGILHKLVFILGKLDPHNRQWKRKQIEKAAEITDATVREKTLEDIEKAFTENELDYGRKLYLIENCIYGVDIQPIAVQIAKMRFFISLIVDQKIDDARPNRGVRPLPNLETKFVAANTLIGVNRPGQQLLRNREIDAKEAELRRVRERHFMARTLASKAKCREQDEKLRAQIAELLKNDGWDSATARKLASWNPYDQNVSADFFDAEWMFGLLNGFDVALGNPPYVLLQNSQIPEVERQHLITTYLAAQYKVDLYHLFIEVAVNMIAPNGVLSYITPNTFLKNKHNNKLREILATKTNILSVVLFYCRVFEDPSVDNLVFVCQRARSMADATTNSIVVREISDGDIGEQLRSGRIFQQSTIKSPEYFFELDITSDTAAILAKIENGSIPFGNIGGSYFGIQTFDRETFVASERRNRFFKPVIDGGNVARYFTSAPVEYVDFQPLNVKSGGDPDIYVKERIVVRQIGRYPEGAICPDGVLTLNTIYNLYLYDHSFDLRYVLALINSRLIHFYWLQRFYDYKETFPKIKKQPLHSIPIKHCKSNSLKNITDRVERITAAKQKNPAADTSALEREIDQQVYALYGLTPEEIKIVEEASK